MPPDEGRDVRGAGLGREERLVGAEAERHVGADALLLEGPDRLEPIGDERHLDHHVLVELRECPPLLAGWPRTRSATTSAETGPSTISQISGMAVSILRPTLARRLGLVVQPSMTPSDAASLISAMSALSMKIFMTQSPLSFALAHYLLCVPRAVTTAGTEVVGPRELGRPRSALAGAGQSRACVIVPAYQAEQSLGAVLDELRAALPELDADAALVVDDGSHDRTAEVGRERHARVVSHVANRGKGAALATGLDGGPRDRLRGRAHGRRRRPAPRGVGAPRPRRRRSTPRAMVLGVRDLARDGAPARQPALQRHLQLLPLTLLAPPAPRHAVRPPPLSAPAPPSGSAFAARGYAFEAEVDPARARRAASPSSRSPWRPSTRRRRSGSPTSTACRIPRASSRRWYGRSGTSAPSGDEAWRTRRSRGRPSTGVTRRSSSRSPPSSSCRPLLITSSSSPRPSGLRPSRCRARRRPSPATTASRASAPLTPASAAASARSTSQGTPEEIGAAARRASSTTA